PSAPRGRAPSTRRLHGAVRGRPQAGPARALLLGQGVAPSHARGLRGGRRAPGRRDPSGPAEDWKLGAVGGDLAAPVAGAASTGFGASPRVWSSPRRS